MRYLFVLPGLMMLAFAAVQYNDPDALLWILLYLVPAAWAFAVAFCPGQVRSVRGERLLWVTVAAGVGVMVSYWPAVPGFWRKEVWWMEETAREGMGVMIGFAVLLAVLAAATAKNRRS